MSTDRRHEKILYLDCSSGISGDMTVAALLDLGASEQGLRDMLSTLPLDGYRINISRVSKSGIDACDFDVILDADHENHDHDMAYLHGTPQLHEHVHDDHGDDHFHEHDDHEHEHEHCHEHDDHDHEHEHCHEHDDHDHEHEHCHEHDDHDHAHGHCHEHDDHDHEHEHCHEHDDHDHEHEHCHEHGDHEHHHGHEHGDHEHHHGHEHGDHEHEHGHDHSHGHDHHHGHGHHHGRNLADITAILQAGSMSEHALELALRIFSIVAQAESHVHGKSIDEVHFHEVGAVDSIVDIAAAAYCLDQLGISRVIISQLNEGQGQIRCQHGLLPIPVPATAQIAAAHALPLHITQVQGELVTPTGAAIAAAIRTDEELPHRFVIRKIGIGAGKRDYACAGILRAMLIDEHVPGRMSANPQHETPHAAAFPANTSAVKSECGEGSCAENVNTEAACVDDPCAEDTRIDDACTKDTRVGDVWAEGTCAEGTCVENAGSENACVEDTDSIMVLEANIDDCSSEALGFTMDELFAGGALDVFFQPIYMKKNRPAVLLTVLCDPALQQTMERLIFRHTTTIGIRRSLRSRTKLPRKIAQVETPIGPALAKVCTYEGETYIYPEYESAAKLARQSGRNYLEVCRMILDCM